jgi:serine/threonine protein kinase
MTPDRWALISQVYHATLTRRPDARAAFLDSACAGDGELRAEIESLLRHSVPSVPALDVVAAQLATVSSQSLLGARLGPYRIRSLIGEGGMGQVYRADDEELGRQVAVKVLPPIFALDPNRRVRFHREARMMASLNHPHIGAIYGIAESDELRGLVLELVEGNTLGERLRAAAIDGRDGLPVREALTIARQIADALDAAHERGIVHRDLKPANIKITADGTVKVLDFGLAKAVGHDDDDDERSDLSAPAQTAEQDTRAGLILGTAAYMSPEQAQGCRVDKRTDIWAFGCVLYEMLTGRQPFAGETVSSTLTAILERDPDWNLLPSTTPLRVVRLLHQCLEKNPKLRLRDIGDARGDLEDGLDTSMQSPVDAKSSRRPTLWTGLAVLVATATGTIVWNVKPVPESSARVVTRVAVAVGPEHQPAPLRGLALSANGRYLVYVSDPNERFRLCVRAMDSFQTKILSGTEDAGYPFFSPDGEWIGFFAGGRLKRVPADGGPVVPVIDLASLGGGQGGFWASDDTIFVAGRLDIWRVAAAGGTPNLVTRVERSNGEFAHRRPLLLPDGETLLYVVWYGPGWDERQIVAQRLGTTKKHVLIRGAGTARYARTGHLIYSRAGAIMAVRFDALRLEVSGAPVTLLEDVREGTIYADYDVSVEGSLAYVQESRETYNRLPVLVDRKGIAQPLPGLAPAYYQGPVFSSDGRQLALMITGSTIEIWIYDFARASLTRLTTEGSSQYPVWSSDGRRIAYRATRAGSRNLFWKSLDGTAAEERLTTSDNVQAPWSSSRDGAALAFTELTDTGSDIWILPLAGDRRPRLFLRKPFQEDRPRFSPSGSWLAYISNESGRSEIYVQSYPGPGPRWQISTGGGVDPVWAPNGRELFYRNGRRIMAVDIAQSATFMASAPRVLFEGNYVFGEPVIDFDVHPDGERFAIIQPGRQDPPVTHINVVMNWFEELKRRVPPSAR